MSTKEELIKRIRARRNSKQSGGDERTTLIKKLREKGVRSEDINPDQSYAPIQGTDRALIQNLATDQKGALDYLHKQHPNSDFRYHEGEIIGKDKKDKEWQRMDKEFDLFDTDTYEAQDVSDIGGDIVSGVLETGGGLIGGALGLAAGAPLGPAGAAGAAYGGGITGAGLAGMGTNAAKQLIAQSLDMRDEFSGKEVLQEGGLSAAGTGLFGIGGPFAKQSAKQVAKQAAKTSPLGKEFAGELMKKAAKGGMELTEKRGVGAMLAGEGLAGMAFNKAGKMSKGFKNKTLATINSTTPEVIDTIFTKYKQLKKMTSDQVIAKSDRMFRQLNKYHKTRVSDASAMYDNLRGMGVRIDINNSRNKLIDNWNQVTEDYSEVFANRPDLDKKFRQEVTTILSRVFGKLSKESSEEGLSNVDIKQVIDADIRVGDYLDVDLEKMDTDQRTVSKAVLGIIGDLRNNITDDIHNSLDKAGLPDNLYKQAKNEWRVVKDLGRGLNKYAKDEDAFYKVAAGGTSKSDPKMIKYSRLSDIVDDLKLKGDFSELSNEIQAHKIFINDPALIPPSGSAVSALAAGGGYLGKVLGEAIGGESGKWLGAGIGGSTAVFSGGPRGVAGLAKNSQRIGNTAEALNDFTSPNILGGKAARSKAIWNSLQNSSKGQEIKRKAREEKK